MSAAILYTGGELATNGYLVPSANGYLCVDAPEGMAEEIKRRGVKIEAVLLTHGHFDHYWDAAGIAEAQACPVYCHAADWPMIQNPKVFASFIRVDRLRAVAQPLALEVPLQGRAEFSLAGKTFTLFHIPGHSLGSVAFYDVPGGQIFGGDILFAGAIGRWDFPGGSKQDLISGIQTHFFPLPESTKVHPGHGPSTTLREEKADNPFLS